MFISIFFDCVCVFVCVLQLARASFCALSMACVFLPVMELRTVPMDLMRGTVVFILCFKLSEFHIICCTLFSVETENWDTMQEQQQKLGGSVQHLRSPILLQIFWKWMNCSHWDETIQGLQGWTRPGTSTTPLVTPLVTLKPILYSRVELFQHL